MKTFSAIWSDNLGKAIKDASNEPYQMRLVGSDEEACIKAINQGIDSHLEAVNFVQFNADGKLGIEVSSDTLSVLVRRLLESGEENALSLASAICETLDIELI